MGVVQGSKRREGGQTLVLFVLALTVMVGFAAMTIDVGMLFEDRRQLQNAADAAALAGVAELPNDPATAKLKAREWAVKHGYTASAIKTIDVQTTAYPNDTIYVELEQDFDWFFGRVLGQTSDTVSGEAAAQVGSLAGTSNFMPWAIMLGDSTCLTLTGQPILNANCTVKVGAGNAITGWYGALDLDGTGGGAAEYRDNIIDGDAETVYCAAGQTESNCQSFDVESLSGNQVAGTDKGIDARLANEPACDGNGNGKDDFGEVFVPDVSGTATYAVACPQAPRLIIVPIVSLNGIPVKTVSIAGWSLAYLKSYSCVGGNCNGTGHWEVQISMVDAVYSQSAAYLGAYNPTSAVQIRRLVK